MSSGSDSDEDFVPGEPEVLSEEESADEETEQQYERELENKSKKRKAIQKSNKGKKKTRTNGVTEVEQKCELNNEEPEQTDDPEEEKKKEEDLWAKFLENTDTKPKSVATPVANQPKPVNQCNKNTPSTTSTTSNKSIIDDQKEKERKIFEFAGETIVVENNVIKEKIKTAESPATVSKDGPSPSMRGRSSSGLSSVLGQLNKKSSLSTLEKSKLDWSTYKKEEGIEEEIDTHNKGKGGYLDRQDFLERADMRQYEIERDLRMSRRSNR